jgi:hypothetical protein
VVSSEHFTDDVFDCSTLAEIQRKITKKGKRNPVSQLIHAKNDKEMIAAWKSDLSKTLLIFNVSSVFVARLSLTVRSQTELALNTNTLVSGIDHMVSDMHHIMVKSQEGVDGKNLSVSITRPLFITG